MVESKNVEVGEALLAPGHDFATITDKISALVLTRPAGRAWYVSVAIALAMTILLAVSVVWLFVRGVGIWGVDNQSAWGFAIVNFVWWIGIGHAGTLISVILLLLRQNWRSSINRFAEATTIFAVICAGIFPLIHVGRPWLAYWLAPYPNTMGTWPQFRSPLLWDAFAISAYASVSFMFWYIGLVPDLATLRDRAQGKARRRIYAILSLGWRGAADHWDRYETAYLILAGIATPLVISVHSVIALDFAVAVIPGWHSTVFPPYFVAGAAFSGFAAVLSLAIPLRKIFGLEDFITARHIENMAKLMLAVGLIVSYGYLMDTFFAWYSSNTFEEFVAVNRMTGPYAAYYWGLISCNVVLIHLLWFRRVRRSMAILFTVACLVNVGMWLERFVIVITSLHRDFLPSSWSMYVPTFWDITTFVGSIGLFALLLLLFIRFLPVISMFEMRGMLKPDHESNLHADEVEAAALLPVEATAEGPAIPDEELYGILAEYRSAADLLRALRSARAAGRTKFEAYTPIPVEEISRELGHRNRVPQYALVAGILGLLVGFGLQYYTSALDYPLLIAGKDPASWPAFVIVAFEVSLFFAGVTCVVGMFLMNGLPQLYHPIFNAQIFELASRNRFFLLLKSDDPVFDRASTCALLAADGALDVVEVPE